MDPQVKKTTTDMATTPWSAVLLDDNWNWDLIIKKYAGHPSVKRAYEARRYCGLWDECDPAANAILELVEAQNEIAQAISAGELAYIDDAPQVGPALEKRATAAVRLMQALLLETDSIWTPQGWPKPAN
jgi:hypothetical protein